MICEVCGKEHDANVKCPACGYQTVGGFLGEVTPEIREKLNAAAAKYRDEVFRDIKVYAIGYIMQEKDGKIVLDSREEIPIAEDLSKMDRDKIYWSPVEYGKETPGQQTQVDVVVKAPSGNKEYSLKAKGPDTKGFWKLGFVLKPGLDFAVVVGDQEVYSESSAAALK